MECSPTHGMLTKSLAFIVKQQTHNAYQMLVFVAMLTLSVSRCFKINNMEVFTFPEVKDGVSQSGVSQKALHHVAWYME